MSASGDGDSIHLNKEGDKPTDSLSEGIPSSFPINKDENCSPRAEDQKSSLPPLTVTTKADNSLMDNIEQNLEEVEAIIEKNLQIDKEKALDVDSELDFELKWDDDADQTENQADLAGEFKETESSQSTVKDNTDVKEPQDTQTTSEKDNLESKNKSNVDVDNAKIGGIKASNLMETVDVEEAKAVNKADDNASNILDDEIGQAEDELLKSDEFDSEDIILNESNTEDDLLKAEGLDVGNASTTAGILNSQTEVCAKVTDTSPNESETNSLDEQLVYSDVDAPDIEDKDLMDEIEAQITESHENIDMSKDSEKLHDIPEILTSQNETAPPESTNMADKVKELEKMAQGTDVEQLKALSEVTSMIEKDLEHLSQVTNAEKTVDGLEEPEKLKASSEITTNVENEKDLGNVVQNTDSEIAVHVLKDNITHSPASETNQKEKESSETNTEIEKEHKRSIKDACEMDVDDDLTKSDQKLVKSGPSDTSSSNTDMETSSYDINKEHGLDKPDVMIEIPTQELIEAFDDSDDTSNIAEETSEIIDSLTDNVITEKPNLIENVDSNTQNVNFKELQAIEDKTNIAVTNSNKDDNYNMSIEEIVPDEKVITVDKDISKSDTAPIAQEENMDIDSSSASEIMEKSEGNICKNTSNLETVQPDKENIINMVDDKINHTDLILEANSEQSKVPNAEHTSNTKLDEEVKKEVNEESSEKSPPAFEEVQKPKQLEDPEPSTSTYHQELSDEDQEVTDSLGLLAESSRVMEDDDEQEQEEQPDDDDDDDDFDQDDESNQMAGDHSEDSSAQQSETDAPKESMDIDAESNKLAAPDLDAGEVSESCSAGDMNEGDDDNADESDKGDFQFQIANVVSEKAEVAEEKDATNETEKAIEALLNKEKAEEPTEVPQAETVETAKQTTPERDVTTNSESKLRMLLLRDVETSNETPEEKTSPSKTKKLEISKPKHEINIVELEESSSEDDIQVVNKQTDEPPASPKDVTSVKIPGEVEVTAGAAGAAGAGGPGESRVSQEPGETVISNLPKPAAHKTTRLNTDEISIKTAAPTAEPLVIPETKAPKTPEVKTPIDLGEIFNLDSDDDVLETKRKRKKKLTAVEMEKARETNKCINANCTSDASVSLLPASASAAIYYAANPQRSGGVCVYCVKRLEERGEKLIQDVKDLTPYLNMDMCMIREDLVEISDSDSDDEVDLVKKDDEIVGEKGAKFLEEHLENMFNDTWKKYNMEARLLTAQTEINVEVRQLEEECKKIDAMLDECQKETDKLRNELYDTFADERRALPPITIYDTPVSQWCGLEENILPTPEVKEPVQSRLPKRRPPPAAEPPAKRAAIPLGYTPLDSDANKPQAVPPPEAKPIPTPVPTPVTPVASPAIDMTSQPEDDNAEISVVKLSVEAAPAGLPGPGAATRPALRPHMTVYAMRNSFGAWHRVTIVDVQPKVPGQFTMCRVRFEQPKNILKILPARCLAYEHPPDVRLTIGTRVIALFKDHRFSGDQKIDGEKKEAYYSGIVAEIPNPVNNYRYLIFFDDGYAQYVQHSVTRLVCECAPRVWDEVHPLSRQFVRDYLRAYPERPMVRLHAGQSIKTEWNGRWWVSKVLQVDASLVHVHFEGKKEGGIDKTEWIYRGSTRLAPLYLELQAAERHRSRPLPRAQAGRRFNMPYVEYTRSDEQPDKPAQAMSHTPQQTLEQTRAQIEQEIRRQRAVAKKSTAPAPSPSPAPAPAPAPARDNVTSRVVFYTPKNAIRPHKMVPHTCGPRCKRTDVLALKDLRTYNPLTKPLLSGWERQQVRYRIPAVKAIMYRAPCGRRIRDYKELHQYLQAIDSDMGVDLFDFNPSTHCLAEFLLNKCLVSKKDLSHGKENVPVPCVNYYDDSLPEFCSYNTERTPTAGVPLNLDPEFLCGCDCTDDCADKTKCACWKMTLEGARTIGLDTDEVGYVYKRLPEPLPSGIYECNVRCKCKQTCLNRVAQHPLQLKLQVFKTANRGWGIRALNDVPKGAFLCVYAGNLLTDATANLDGLNEGDEYLAELDYIEVVEAMKEGFEEDIPEDAKKLDQEEEESSSMSSSSDEEPSRENGDDDFRPMLPAGDYRPSEYSKRLRKRDKSKKAKEKEDKDRKEREQKKDGNTEDCITISDDEELREPARFAAQKGMGGKEFVSKYKSVRAHFGKDEACYIMDAKVQGNIGRYLNHSCTPNVFVQNVFVDTHDPRFPWVAFFALSQIRAGTELTWNYNYDVGSVPGKVLYCYCNAPNCRGRLL